MSLFIEHQQLSVRPFTAEDKQDFVQLVQHPLCMKYSITGILSEQQANDCFDTLLNNKKHKMYAIQCIKSGFVIGCTGLQDCFIDEKIEPSFILRLLPDFHDHQDLLPTLTLLIEQLLLRYQLPELQTVISQKNQLNMQLMSALQFRKTKAVTCRGIASYLYK
ncbi:MAG: GNAT family N-acetyltransferase, partial [Psychromonas sp.]